MFATPGVNTLQIGDEIISVNGVDVFSIEDLVIAGKELVAPAFYTVLRDKRRVGAQGPVPFPALVSQVQPRSAAIEAGIKVGDVITRIDGQVLNGFADLQAAVATADADEMLFSVWREGSEFDVTLTSRLVAIPELNGSFENRRLVGITGGIFFEPGKEPLPFGIAITAALKRTWYIITVSLAGIKQMVLGSISACNLSGPVAIAETAGQVASQGAVPFLALIAGLSTAIGLMNLFPIPVLDGGHLLFCAYEFITGRKPSDSVLQILMTFGLGVVLSLTLFAVVMNEIC
jgi:regulator of sigma E protease